MNDKREGLVVEQIGKISQESLLASKSLMRRYLVLELTRHTAFGISGMFIILYLLDTLPLFEVGIVFAVSYFITTFVDYPTGALGDAIGHKRVLIIAYIFHLISLALLIVSNTFIPLLLYSALSAFAFSQESGALEAWFDNSYRLTSEQIDPDREVYKAFQARKAILFYIFSGSSFIIGGMIAYEWSRKVLFGVSFIGVLVVFLLIIILMTTIRDLESKLTFRSYLHQFSSGIWFFISDKGVFLYFIGSTITWAANNSIWVNYLLFPTYANYTGGSDNLTALLRAIIFASGVLWQLIAIRFISKIKRINLWIFITAALSNPIFFFLVYLYYWIAPPTTVDLALIFGLFLVFQLPGMWESLEFTLRNRLNLDLVPDKLRNSIYSLLPTITTLIGIPGTIIGSWFISIYGFTSGILLATIISLIGVLIVGIGLKQVPGKQA
ncbi:MAG: hypothetical protein ACFFC7_20010 [Candidatus Hermodarchaeota archaeon]